MPKLRLIFKNNGWWKSYLSQKGVKNWVLPPKMGAQEWIMTTSNLLIESAQLSDHHQVGHRVFYANYLGHIIHFSTKYAHFF